ncbi:hypothetical protein HK405_010216 [Cladochytrium tenue]|nr:hypothetical protein HK405_010216 [Cladochytrium tenue]
MNSSSRRSDHDRCGGCPLSPKAATSTTIAAALGCTALTLFAAATVARGAPLPTADYSSSDNSSSSGPGVTGNCLSGTYTFDATRMYEIPTGALSSGTHYPPVLAGVDWSAYDFTIDYSAGNAVANASGAPAGGVSTRVAASSKTGTRISTTRYMMYGKVSMKIKATAPSVGGIVSPFITMSDRGDEIDWELLPAVTSGPATTNVFYKAITVGGKYGGVSKLPSGNIDDFHEYTIDWNSQRIEWSIDGTVVRTFAKSDSYDSSVSDYYYPSTPSIVQIGAWDGGDSSSSGTSEWAGGPVSWGDNTYLETLYGPLTVQCYNDKDEPVAMWPIEGNRNETTATTTSSAGRASVTTTTTQKVVEVQPETSTVGSLTASYTGSINTKGFTGAGTAARQPTKVVLAVAAAAGLALAVAAMAA